MHPDSERSEEISHNGLMRLLSVGFGGLLLFVILFFVCDRIVHDRPGQIDVSCSALTGFERVKGQEREKVDLPCELQAEYLETIVLETTLPDKIPDDTWIDYYSGKNSRILVNGEVRRTFDRRENTLPGGVVKGFHMFVELHPEDAGGILTIERTGERGGSNNFRAVYIGNSLGLIEHILLSKAPFFILSITLLIVSLIAIAIGLLLKFYKKIKSPIAVIGIAVLFVSLWLIFDSELYQLAFQDVYIDGTMSFLMMLLIPYPFLYYLNMLQEDRYRKIFIGLTVFLEAVSLCFLVIHFSGLLDFLTMLPVMALCLGVVIAGGEASLVMDYMRGYYKGYRISFIGIVGFAVSCVIEIVLIFTVEDRYDGSMIVLGLYWVLILAIVHQLNEVREAQRETAKAVRANETKSNFLANMSHEIRTPMNAILGMDEMILREAKDNEKVMKYASDIRSAGNMLLAIINDILDLSKLESGKAELIETDFEICSVINDLINITRKRALDKGLEYCFDAEPDLPVRMHGDEIRVRQVMLNVINNAVKYTEKGSVRVHVCMERVPREEKGTMIVSVRDTGIGIREEDRERLFDSFGRLEETRNRNIEGTGLGLNIANRYIEMMGGQIEVESVYGEGSTFTLYIPLAIVDATPIGDFTDAIRQVHEDKEEYSPTIMAPNARVLVVDDNEMNLEVICGLMESTKIRVETALSGPEGIDKMEKRRYDLVFLDQMMPGMDGVTTLEIMRGKFDMRGVAVIALTADAVAGAKEFYLDKGFDGYLSKPVRAQELEKALMRFLPPALLLGAEDIARITSAEKKEKPNREAIPADGDPGTESRTGAKKDDLRAVLVVDVDTEALKQVKGELGGVFNGTYVTDAAKARKFLEKHEVSYVMVRKDAFLKMQDADEAGP